jgi:dipeptidyl aminopeptidase/acylaminoacyl peptidase
MKQNLAFVAALLAMASLSLPAASAPGKPSMQAVLAQVQSVVDLGDTAIAPNGSSVAWSQTLHHQTSLWIENLATHRRTRLTAGNAKAYAQEGDMAWSPDGSQIAFLSDARTKDHPQLYLAHADGSDVHRVGSLTGAAQDVSWSPDGTRLAFLYIAHPHRKAGATQAGARQVGVIGSVNDEQQIATMNPRTGGLSLVTPPGDYVYEYNWAPKSQRFALTYARGNGDNNWWIAKLATIAANGGALHDVLAPGYQINDPRWSPDGKTIAIIGGLMSDFGSVGGDVYLVNTATQSAKDVTPGMHYSAASLHWSSPQTIAMVAHRSGALHLVTLDIPTGAMHEVLGGEDTLRGVTYAKNGAIALVRTSFTRAPEVWTGRPQALRQLTRVNVDAPKLSSRAVSLHWSNEGFNIQGWLVYPKNYNPARTYPMITIIHGGPGAETTPSYNNLFGTALAASGYFIFAPNPRGSFGEGEAFTRANRKDFGYGDWRDDLAGVDAAIKAAPIDPHRLGLFGWSYGGYMAMWAETQTQRFKGIVAGAGVVNWQSYYGQNNINKWMIPFFGASVYDDPAVYAKSSPITFITHSHTPVLILQGERDEEVPAPQAFEFYNAMQTLGVPSRLVVYAGEGHGIRKPSDVVDLLKRTVAWFDWYLR